MKDYQEAAYFFLDIIKKHKLNTQDLECFQMEPHQDFWQTTMQIYLNKPDVNHVQRHHQLVWALRHL